MRTALTVAIATAVLLVVDAWTVRVTLGWVTTAGWSVVLVLLPTSATAVAVGWTVARLTRADVRTVVPWTLGLFIGLRVAYTLGGWFHGDIWTHAVAVVLMPAAPALGFWAGSRLAST